MLIVTQLPRAAVLGNGPVAGATLCALVDSGLDARLFLTSEKDLTTEAYLRERGLADRGTRFGGTGKVHPVDDGRRPFDVQPSNQAATRWDVVILAGDITGRTETGTGPFAVPPARFGGVFDPDAEGVYRCGHLPLAGSLPSDTALPSETTLPSDTADIIRLAEAQGRWVGEYLRGRYLLPARSAMLAAAGAPGWRRSRAAGLLDRWPAGPGWHHGRTAAGVTAVDVTVDGYLRWLSGELRRGRARAAEGGYPLPVPSLIITH